MSKTQKKILTKIKKTKEKNNKNYYSFYSFFIFILIKIFSFSISMIHTDQH